MIPRIMQPERLVVAIGGNATHPENIRGTTGEQEQVAARAARSLFPLLARDNRLVITHGNGPVVGKILLRQYYAREHIPQMRLDVCVAHSQGGIAHLLMQGLEDELARNECDRRIACVLTRVEVEAEDPGFTHPSKPIGPFFSEEEARNLERTLGWTMMEDAGRGWRYIVASPRPRRILDLELIASLAEQGYAVIAAGGGGIPVVRRADGSHAGVPAVIDKDLTSALLATSIGADTLLMLTAVPRVAIDFGKPTQRALETVSATELAAYQKAGHFGKGSMGPKVDGALRFLAAGGKRAIIAHLDEAAPALDGSAGTHVVPG
ncbi:MAG: carbamate kinase [Betaproteobacteria bacterium]|nr:carbamate kinase [Betaproteobacteria bacterium]